MNPCDYENGSCPFEDCGGSCRDNCGVGIDETEVNEEAE